MFSLPWISAAKNGKLAEKSSIKMKIKVLNILQLSLLVFLFACSKTPRDIPPMAVVPSPEQVAYQEMETIGFKRLLRIPPIKARKLRLLITRSLGTPALSGFGLYKASARETGT